MDTVKLAAKRIEKAERWLYEANDLLVQAQACLSVVLRLNQNHSKIGSIKESIKVQIYDLERCRRSGFCDLDETTAAMIEKKAKKNRRRA